jgi:ligand-binding sensor domain-containing protein/signal transduction histidine kinase
VRVKLTSISPPLALIGFLLLGICHSLKASPAPSLVANTQLALWLRADKGVVTNESGLVVKWEDQSGNNHHAIQTNTAATPRFLANAFQQKPALHFDGVSSFLEVAHSSKLIGTGDLLIFAVVRVDEVDNSTNSIFSKTTGNLPAPFDLYLNPGGQPRFFMGDGQSYGFVWGNKTFATGEVRILAVFVEGINATTLIDGDYNGHSAITNPSKDLGGPLLIGTRDDFAQWLKGDLAELIYFRGAISRGQQTEIHDYLGRKYGVDAVIGLNINEQPMVGRYEGQTATFSATARSSHPQITFQWQRNGIDIPEATNSTYTTPILTPSDHNSNYRVRISTPETNRFGGSVLLTILPDTEPLTITTAAFLLRDQSQTSTNGHSSGMLPPYSSRFWRVNDDPARNVIQAITQTSDGVLWVGTEAGLAWFDGERFEFVPVGPSRVSVQKINALNVDHDGSLWVGTAGQGLLQWQRGHWNARTPESVDQTVLTLERGHGDSLWVGTRAGLGLLKNDKFALLTETSFANRPIRSIAQHTNGSLWIGTSDQVICFSETGAASHLNLSNGTPTFTRTITGTRDGSIWIGANSGLIQYRDGDVRHFTKNNGLPDNVVTAIYEDRRGNLWIGTSGGLCRFADGKFVVEMTADGEAYDQILCLFEDRENNFWVGAKNGLYQLSIQQFTTYTTRHGLAHNNVISVYEDNDGAMWIGTWGGGLHRLRGGKISIYSSARNKIMRNDLVLAIGGSREGGIWFGADYDGGLYRLKDDNIVSYGWEHGFGPTPVRVISEDVDGRVLIGTSAQSLKVLQQGRVSDYDQKRSLPATNIRCVLRTSDGVLWVGTEAGLAFQTNDIFATFKAHKLPEAPILSLYEDSEQTLWVGTTKGLGRLLLNRNGASDNSDRFTFYTSSDGLFDDSIVEILEDDAENLWIASRRGVFRIHKREFDRLDASRGKAALSCVAFGQADGMNSPVCVGVAKPSAWKSRDGRLWFATTKGLAVTDPKLEIQKNETPPPVIIRKVFADKSEVSDLASAILRFPPGRGEIEFHYTALSYAMPEKNRFKFKLEGLDADWVEAGSRRVAFYNNVPPGNYTFQVMASNNDGVWNSASAQLKFSLSPNFWQTWWCQAAFVVAGLSFAAAAARFVTKRAMQLKLERLEQQHAIAKERTRIAQDMHDELGARLTEIRVLSNLTAQNKSQPAVVDTQARRISSAAEEVIDNLHSIVWAVNPGNDAFENLADYVCQFAESFLETSSIRCRFDFPDEMPDLRLSSEVRHNVFLACKESLNNAVKHAEATEVQISLSVSHAQAVLSIADNGKGFQTGTTTGLGNGLRNMKRRMESIGGYVQITSEPGKGTRTSLLFPLNSVSSTQ